MSIEGQENIAAPEVPIVAPEVVSTGGENLSFIDNFKTRFGVDVPDEASALEMVNQWKSQTDIVSQREMEANELKAKLAELSSNQVEYQSEATRQLDDYIRKIKAEGASPEQVSEKVAQFWQQANINYIAMAEKDPMKVIEHHVRDKYAGEGFDDATIAALVDSEFTRPDAPDVDDYHGDDDPAYIKAKAAYDKANLLFNVKVKGIAKELEAKKPKLDFQPVGVKTPEQLKVEAEASNQMYAESFGKFRDGFKGVQVGNEVIPFEMFGADGNVTPEFKPVFEKLTKPFEFIDSMFLKDKDGNVSDTPDAGRITRLMLLEHSLPKLFEKAKSDALKEFQKQLPGYTPERKSGDGANGADIDILSGEHFRRTVLNRT